MIAQEMSFEDEATVLADDPSTAVEPQRQLTEAAG
jgi:hypothetical protein